MAGTTGLEPATSAVTGQRSNQLSYVPKLRQQLGCGVASFSIRRARRLKTGNRGNRLSLPELGGTVEH